MILPNFSFHNLDGRFAGADKPPQAAGPAMVERCD
jgi:hypothetical protein